MNKKSIRAVGAILFSLFNAAALVACGGGGADSEAGSVVYSGSLNLAYEPGAPVSVNNTASDGLNWFNFRRQQLGLPALTRDTLLASAAQAHSDYQKLNNIVTHDETPGAPGFTGVNLGDRLAAAGYVFTQSNASGEVIAATSGLSAFAAAEELITMIYHRFMIFEPTFFTAGAGAASVTGGQTYFTTTFTADGLGNGLGPAAFVTYPRQSQQNLPLDFFSDLEIPDPVAGANRVGYPVSVHADIPSVLQVTSFTIKPQGGALLATKLLEHDSDGFTPTSAAAIVPLSPLAAATTYDVQFSGRINGIAVARSWSFSTR